MSQPGPPISGPTAQVIAKATAAAGYNEPARRRQHKRKAFSPASRESHAPSVLSHIGKPLLALGGPFAAAAGAHDSAALAGGGFVLGALSALLFFLLLGRCRRRCRSGDAASGTERSPLLDYIVQEHIKQVGDTPGGRR